MNYLQLYNSLCKITIVFICLVICAGGFVRMTGSGMGCPDWPKCFGVWIPPTSVEQITWQKETSYKSGQILIKNQSLWFAQNDVISKNNFNKDNWKKYEKHDYAKFNVAHTWTEYINRLFGALAGLFCCALFMTSIFTKNWYVIVFSTVLCLLMVFQAWLGGQVVESNLDENKITTHMLSALLILSLLFLLNRITALTKTPKNDLQKIWISLAIVISLIQIVLGTQVREEVDELMKNHERINIITHLSVFSQFHFHKIIALLVFSSNAALVWYYRKWIYVYSETRSISVIIACLICSGGLMNYYGLIGVFQLLHLIFAASLLMLQVSILLKQLHLPTVRFP